MSQPILFPEPPAASARPVSRVSADVVVGIELRHNRKTIWAGYASRVALPSSWPKRLPDPSALDRGKRAVAEGDYVRARQLAEEALRKSPEDEPLRRLAQVLAPPRAVAARPEASQSAEARSANRQWLRENAASYRGQWVAVQDGRLLGSAPTVAGLRALVGDTRRALVTEIL